MWVFIFFRLCIKILYIRIKIENENITILRKVNSKMFMIILRRQALES